MIQNIVRRVLRGNRGRIEIIAEVLEHAGKPAKKTQIMRRCNLSYQQLKRYLSLTRSNGLIRRKKNGEEITHHRTGKGLKFLTLYKDVFLLLHS